MISAIILTKNEEKNIAACLNSLLWCDEVILIDDKSIDKTLDIAQKSDAKIYEHSLENDFAKQRNFGLTKASGDWVLFVDADERVSLSLQYEIVNIVSQQNQINKGFYIPRIDQMWGKKLLHGEEGSVKLLRLAKKDAGLWQGKVHEVWKIKGKTSVLNNSLEHFPHRTIKELLIKINFYTDLRSRELYSKKIKVHWWSIILFPKAKFILNYFIKRGFLDGTAGLVSALLMSFHSFLVRGKLWLLWQNTK